MRESTRWGNTQVKVHLGRLLEMEYVVVHRGRQGQGFVYELAYAGEGKDGAPFLPGLIEVDALEGQARTTATLRGIEDHLAGVRSAVGRRGVGPRSERLERAEPPRKRRAARSQRGRGRAGASQGDAVCERVVRASRRRVGRARGVMGRRKKAPPPGDPNDPEGLYAWLLRYLEALRIKNYSERTIENRESYLGFFIAWCEARSLTRPQEVTKPILDRYQRYLFHLRKPDGKPLTFSAQLQRLTPVRAFFKWLTRSNVLLWNPASELELPRQEKRLPKHVLTAEEAERVLDQPNVLDPIGLRDRAILETLYSTGIRRMEVIHLSVYDLDAERGTLMVRQGKGKKDRIVPIGERAIAWIRKYVDEARGQLAVPPDEGVLFLTQEGEAISPERLTQLVREYVLSAETGKSGSCHLFRHTCATLMLEGGADIRYIQEMLGHVELSTTQIYTQVSIRRLKAVHALTHPSAKIDKPTASTKTPAGDANGARGTPSVVADTKPLLDPRALETLAAAVVDGDVRASGAAVLRDDGAELMASLADEAEEG